MSLPYYGQAVDYFSVDNFLSGKYTVISGVEGTDYHLSLSGPQTVPPISQMVGQVDTGPNDYGTLDMTKGLFANTTTGVTWQDRSNGPLDWTTGQSAYAYMGFVVNGFGVTDGACVYKLGFWDSAMTNGIEMATHADNTQTLTFTDAVAGTFTYTYGSMVGGPLDFTTGGPFALTLYVTHFNGSLNQGLCSPFPSYLDTALFQAQQLVTAASGANYTNGRLGYQGVYDLLVPQSAWDTLLARSLYPTATVANASGSGNTAHVACWSTDTLPLRPTSVTLTPNSGLGGTVTASGTVPGITGAWVNGNSVSFSQTVETSVDIDLPTEPGPTTPTLNWDDNFTVDHFKFPQPNIALENAGGVSNLLGGLYTYTGGDYTITGGGGFPFVSGGIFVPILGSISWSDRRLPVAFPNLMITTSYIWQVGLIGQTNQVGWTDVSEANQIGLQVDTATPAVYLSVTIGGTRVLYNTFTPPAFTSGPCTIGLSLTNRGVLTGTISQGSQSFTGNLTRAQMISLSAATLYPFAS